MTEVAPNICSKLHETYPIREYDNEDIWAGNLSIELDGIRFDSTMARAFVRKDIPRLFARIQVAFYLRDLNPPEFCENTIQARAWTDIDTLGTVDDQGVYHNDPCKYLPMRLVVTNNGSRSRIESTR